MNTAEHSTQGSDMFTARVCPGCGARIRVGAPDGLCPRCLLGLALGLNPGEQSPLPSNSCAQDTLHVFPDSRRFGNYELTEEIARGGMGIVYRARQLSLNRTVAVKVLLFGQFSSAEFVKRFRAEAEAVASLRHPNIVGIHEVGEHDGQHYFSMDYIDGTDLSQLVRQTPMPARQSALLLKTIAEAVDYAHGRGILHRDLKPSNVLIDRHGQPHITDFGLAKRLSSDNHITLTGQIFGSPGYMAPEQVSPGKVESCQTADIYSVGAILYYLLTGRAPFVAESVEATLAQILTGEFLSPRKLNPGLPADLETICLKCLEREPARRYATAAELADELGRFLRGEPIRARPVGVIEKGWRWSKRNPINSGLGAGLVVLLVAFIAYSLISSSRIRLEARHARLAEQESRSELWQSYLTQARAVRLSGQAGQRFDSLDATRRATAIRPSLELRNEAIAALALPDVRLTNTWAYTESPVTYSSTLERFAVRQPDGQISVRQSSNGMEIARLPALAQVARWLNGFSADDRLLAVNCYDNANYVWDLGARKPIVGPLSGTGCALMPDGSEFVVAGSDSIIRFYAVSNSALLRSVALFEPLNVLLLQPDSHLMGGFQRDGSPVFHLLELPGGHERFAWTNPAPVAAAALSQDGESLAVGCYDMRVYIWNTRTGASRAVLEGHEHQVVGVGFNHAGTLLATTSWDNTFRLWDTASWKQVLRGHGTSFELKFDAQDRVLAHIQQGDVAGTMEIASSSVFCQLHAQANAHYEGWSVDISPDGRLAATAHTDGVAIRDMASGAERAFLPVTSRSAMFVPDGSALITSGQSGLVLWPIASSSQGGEMKVRVGERGVIRDGLPFMGATLGDHGRWVAAANPAANRRAGSVALYEVAHPENRFGLTELPGIQFISATADMRWLAAGTWGGTGVNVWNVPERRLERSLPVPGSANVAFSPDGTLLATGGTSYKVWQAGSWRQLYEVLKPNPDNIPGLMTFSPDSRWLAVLKRRDIALLDAATGHELATLEAPHQPWIRAFCFNADASKLISLQADQSLQIWDLRAVRRELAALKLAW
jgi:serine/threonine protein kinase/WD40 repeat protein